MRFRTFLVTGVEVLHLGGDKLESNTWPAEHWRTEGGRWRIATEAIDAHMSTALSGLTFGPTVDGFVLALEIADFSKWPPGTFAPKNAPHSFKRKYRDLWCFGKLDWLDIRLLPVEQQYEQYKQCVLTTIERLKGAKRMPRDFALGEFEEKIADALSSGNPLQFTRAAFYVP
jgi:hypothetical protein